MNNKPKLLYIIGPNFCVNSLARESLEMLSIKYQVICISEGPPINNSNFKHITIHFEREPSVFTDFRCLLQLVKIIYNNRDASKIVVSTPKISFIAAIACRLNLKSYIYLHRGAVYQNFKGIKFKIYKSIDKFTIKGSKNTTFISKSLHSWVIKQLNLKYLKYNRKFNSSKGVNLTKFFQGSRIMDSQKIIIGFCGRIVRDKGFEELINLAEIYRDDPGVVIKIKGKIELSQNDFFTLNRLITDNIIEYSEWDDNVVSFFHSIDILFFPSKREGFGNVLIEAAACGVPSIGFRIPGVIDAIVEYKSGLLIDIDSDILQVLKKIISNKQDLVELFSQARSTAEANFDQNLVLKDIHRSMGL